MTWCYVCKYSSFPTKINGDLIPNSDGVIEGKCNKMNKTININISACSYGNESEVYETAIILNEHNYRLSKEMGIITKTRYKIINKCPHCFSKNLIIENKEHHHIFICKRCKLNFKNPLRIKRYVNYQR